MKKLIAILSITLSTLTFAQAKAIDSVTSNNLKTGQYSEHDSNSQNIQATNNLTNPENKTAENTETQEKQPSTETLKKADNPIVVLQTAMGNIVVELFPDKAPATVENFLKYVDEGFYDNTLFHRVVRSFVIQGGGFDANMEKKPILYPTVFNESHNRLNNDRGTIAMARLTNPHSASSQFFINVGMNLSLDYRFGKPGYTVFGQVISGMEVVKNINKVKTAKLGGMTDVPIKPVILIKAYRKNI